MTEFIIDCFTPYDYCILLITMMSSVLLGPIDIRTTIGLAINFSFICLWMRDQLYWSYNCEALLR